MKSVYLSRGFTVLELTIGLAIMALLATLALSGVDYFKKKSLRMEGSDLVHAITVSQIQYRDQFNRYANYGQLTARFPTVVSSNFAVTVSPVVGFEYQQYDATLVLNTEQRKLESGCARYTVNVRGGLMAVKAFDVKGVETTRSCIYR